MAGVRPGPHDALVLAGTVEGYWNAWEADLRAVYGLDARAVCWGPDAWGCRRLVALLHGLGPSSALQRALTGHHWTDETSLLALVADRLGVMAAGMQYQEQVPPVPRPDALTPTPPPPASPDEVVSFFAGG